MWYVEKQKQDGWGDGYKLFKEICRVEGLSLKGKIKNYAKSNNIAAQVVLQNYMFECLLARLAHSSYKDKFVVKDGRE